jgi:uridine kinase
MDLENLKAEVIGRRANLPVDRALLVGISGIDASGKGFVSERIAAALTAAGYRVALINADGWLNLPHVRFAGDDSDRGRHFYENALRLDEMFERLVLPLAAHREVDLTMDFAAETADDYRPQRVVFTDIDIILLEGIFIFKRRFTVHFDLKVWLDCYPDTALTRAIARQQEGLSPAQTIAAYQTIYFPAQKYHLEIDDPRSVADIVVTTNSMNEG